MQQPCKWHSNHHCEGESRPIAEMIMLYWTQDKLNMNEISLQTQHSKPCHALVKPLRSAAEKAIEQDYSGHCERDIEHSLNEKREMSVLHLLKPDAAPQCHSEHYPHHPDALTIQCMLLFHHIAHVDAEEEDWHTAPEYLYMSYCMMDRTHPLHQYAPHHHHQNQPTIDRMTVYQFHIWRRKEVEHHRGWNVPESQFVANPEIPVDENVAKKVHPMLSIKARNIIKAGDNQP